MNGFLPSVTLFLIGTLLLSNADSRTLNAGYIIGDLAEDFSLENYDGRMISMASYPDAKGFIIVFTSNHCPYAEAYEDRLISLHRKFADKGYPLIAINPNAPDFAEKDNMEAIRKKAKSKKFPFPYL